MSDSVRPHTWQPTRLPRPWDSPGKNTGVGCYFLRQVHENEKWKWSHLVVSDPQWPHCSLPGSSVHGIFQARVLEWGAIAFSDIFYILVLYQICLLQISSPSLWLVWFCLCLNWVVWFLIIELSKEFLICSGYKFFIMHLIHKIFS